MQRPSTTLWSRPYSSTDAGTARLTRSAIASLFQYEKAADPAAISTAKTANAGPPPTTGWNAWSTGMTRTTRAPISRIGGRLFGATGSYTRGSGSSGAPGGSGSGGGGGGRGGLGRGAQVDLRRIVEADGHVP